MKKTLIATAALGAILNLAGCMTAGRGYHYDHGDLVSQDGDVRYIGWCDVHPHNSHCQNPATAIRPGVIASVEVDPTIER